MPDQIKTFTLIQPGHMVAYNQNYLDRQTLTGTNLMYARGKVTALHRVANDMILADVDWDTAGLSKRVYVKDLVKV